MNQRKNKKREDDWSKKCGGVTIFTEVYTKNKITNASVYAGKSKKSVIAGERCVCDDPYDCICDVHQPPSLSALDKEELSLFRHQRPYLMYTVQRGKHDLTRFAFFCKMEIDVHEEVERLNSSIGNHPVRWSFLEEEGYNRASFADYQEALAQQHALGY